MKNRELGQGAIEFVIYFNALLVLITGVMATLYLVYTRSITDYQLQKTALCLEKFEATKPDCTERTSSLLKKNLWFHKNQNILISKRPSYTKVTFKYSFLGTSFSSSKRIEITR